MNKMGLTVCVFACSIAMLSGQSGAQDMFPIEAEGWGDPSDAPQSEPAETQPPVDCVTVDGEECAEGCDSEDCIDERPNHECENGEDDCNDSDLSLELDPCSDTGESCEEDDEDDEDGGNDGPFQPISFTHEMSQADLASVKRTTMARAHEEVARKGGYLADINHDNVFGFDLSDTMNPDTISNMLSVSGWYIRRFGLNINIVIYRESLKGMAADVLGELVQTYPYKRRRCGLIKNVGQGFRWRLGARLMVEEGIIWNRHISPMVDASIEGVPDEIEEQLMEIVREHGLEDHTTITVTVKRCGHAPDDSDGPGLP